MLSDSETGRGVIRDQTSSVFTCRRERASESSRNHFASLPKKRSFQFAGMFYLPQSIAAMRDPIELVQCTDAGAQRQFLSIQ
jgi:hypothetical protein